MAEPTWIPLARPLPDGWVDARLQVHHALQLLASFSGVLLAPMREDRHRSVCWEAGCDAFVTGSPADHPDLRVELALAPFELRVRSCDALETLALAGRTLAEARSWLEGVLAETFDSVPELGQPEYAIPDHPVAGDARLNPAPSALAAVHAWFHDAALALSSAAAHAEMPHHGVRCWPHHFDIALLLEVGRNDASARCTVGIGMTPGDEGREAPYWYVTPYPYDFDADRAELSLGRWQTDGWLGVVLEADELLEAEGAAAQTLCLRRFLDEAVAAAAATLGVTPPEEEALDLRLPGRLPPSE